MPSVDSGSNNLNILAERMKAKMEQERMETETLIKQQFSDLSENLKRSSQYELRTTESAIQQQITNLQTNITSHCRTLSWAFGKRCLQIIMLSASLLLGTALGGWGIMSFMQNKIVNLSQEMTTLQVAKDRIEQDYREVEAKFKGIQIMTSEGKTFIVLPERYTAQPGWTVGNKEAISIIRK